MRRNQKNIYVLEIIVKLIKFIFQILFFSILIYQLIEITNNYLNFPYEVKLNVKDSNDLNLPSITFCLKKDNLRRKSNFESKRFLF